MNQFTPIPGTHVAINWATIPVERKFVTVNYFGEIRAYFLKPYAYEPMGVWTSDFNDALPIVLDTIRLTFENWQTLIFERPEQ